MLALFTKNSPKIVVAFFSVLMALVFLSGNYHHAKYRTRHQRMTAPRRRYEAMVIIVRNLTPEKLPMV